MLEAVQCSSKYDSCELSAHELRTAKRLNHRSPKQVKIVKRKTALNDSQLVEKLKEGSEEAFIELIDLYKNRLMSVVFRFVGNSSEAEDIVQDVLLKVIKNIRSFNNKSALYTWLYRIAVNAAVDYTKKFRQQGVLSIYTPDGEAHEIPSDEEGPESFPQRREMAALLRNALDELSEKHKAILILREFEGLSYSNIAEVLDCSKGTVESRLFRARNRLREKMERYL